MFYLSFSLPVLILEWGQTLQRCDKCFVNGVNDDLSLKASTLKTDLLTWLVSLQLKTELRTSKPWADLFFFIYFNYLLPCVCVLAGGPHRGDPQQQWSDILQDLPGGLLLWGGPEAPLWTARHQLWEQWPPWCWLPGGHGVHLGTGKVGRLWL